MNSGTLLDHFQILGVEMIQFDEHRIFFHDGLVDSSNNCWIVFEGRVRSSNAL